MNDSLISLTYSKEKNYLLIDEIYKLLDSKDFKKSFYYFISFDSSRGDIINLHLNPIGELQVDAPYEEIKSYFESFFLLYPSNSKSLKMESVQSFFLNFPNNSVYFGLHDSVFKSEKELELSIFRRDITNLFFTISRFFRHKLEENATQVIFEILLLCFREFSVNGEQIKKYNRDLINFYLKDLEAVKIQRIEKISAINFQENEKNLVSMANDCLRVKKKVKSNWKKQWLECLKAHQNLLFFMFQNMEILDLYKLRMLIDLFPLNGRLNGILLLEMTLNKIRLKK